ncbi:MAG: thioesterase II family protein, partial [Streptomycetales bacterium]
EIAHDPDMKQLLLPAIRADFTACEHYRYRPDRPLSIPVWAFAGAGDTEVQPTQMLGWGDETTGNFRHTVLPGGHFFNLTADSEFPSHLKHVLATPPLTREGLHHRKRE